MTITHTIVVEFPDGGSPSYHASMECLGGKVVAAAFDGNRLEIEQELLDALQGLVEYGTDSPQHLAAEAAISKATGIKP